MKYLVLLAVLVVAIGIWRSRRPSDTASTGNARRPLALPEDMVACAHCGVHVPKADALVLAGQTFCSAEHRDKNAH